MKTIQLIQYSEKQKDSIFTKDKFFWVHLGNGVNKKFKNRKNALKYLAQTSKFLTFKLHEINIILKEVYSMYRTCYWYMRHNKTSMNAENFERERKIIYFIRSSEDSFDRSIDKAHTENGNHFTFSNIDSCLNNLSDALEILQDVNDARNAYAETFDVGCLQARILYIKEEINNYILPVKKQASENKTFYPSLKVIG